MRRGYTLIELIITVVIIAVSLSAMAAVYQTVLARGVRGKVITATISLAEEKMDEVLRLGYSSISDEGPTAFSSPFGDYSYEVDASNVRQANLDRPVGAVTGYKKVTVSVTHDMTGTYSISSLLTEY